MINYNVPKLDSLRLIIPIEEVTINPNHKEFNQHIAKVNVDSGEILEAKNCNMYRNNSNPCSALYQLGTMVNNGVSHRVIKIGFSSKTLQATYFEGINKNNIDKILAFINNEGVIKISKETLLKAWVVDVDVCFDLKLNKTTIEEVVSICSQLSIKHRKTAVNAFNQASNKGIEWSNRNKVGKSYKTKQYLKFYAKALELKHNSTLFYETYIKNTPVNSLLEDEKLLRVETTIKNKAHFATYGLDINNLRDLLNVDLSKYLNMFSRPINHYMTGYKPIKTMSKLSPTDKITLELVNAKIEFLNLTQSEAIEVIASDVTTDRQTKNRVKKRLEKITNEYRLELQESKDKNQLDIITEIEKQGLIPKS